jgi:HAE1 family hydrophobic/amphiphilic exporter-1
MVMGIVVILGILSFSRLSIDLLPNIQFPVAMVITDYPGAGPLEVENIVTRNIERAMATVNNLKEQRSISSTGRSMIILEFHQGTNLDFATLDMREKLDFIKGMLPDGVNAPIVFKMDPNMMPIMAFGAYKEGMDMAQTKTWVEDFLKPRIESVDGVASVTVSGGYEREIKVIVDPGKLAHYGLTMLNIVNALRMDNLNLPGGAIVEGNYNLLVRTTGEFTSIEDIKKTPVISPRGVYILEDIALIEEGERENLFYSKINDQDAIHFSVQKESTANTVMVARRVNKEIERLKNQSNNTDIIKIFDQSVFINRSINAVARNVIIGGLLAIVVLFFFLKNPRPVLVIATAIPLSVIATFIFIYFSGITLNMISLGGLALGVGMLIDNSIVVLENIFRMQKEEKDPKKVAILGSNQVAMAITASTLTTISVFLPIFFVEGIAAEIFKELALTVAFSLTASLVVALTLVPMLSSKLLKGEDLRQEFINQGINKWYKSALNWSLAHRKTVVFLTLLIFALSFLVVPFLGAEFFPEMDQGQIDIRIRMPKGTKFEETLLAVNRVEEVLKDIKEVKEVASTIGVGGSNPFAGGGLGSDSGNITIILDRMDKRGRDAKEIGEEIRNKTTMIPGARIEVSSGGFIGSLTGGGAPISIDIKGEELSILNNISEDIKGIVEGVRGTREVNTSLIEGLPELRISLDKGKAAPLGITVPILASSVQYFLQGISATPLRLDGKEIDIRVQVPYKRDYNISDLEEIPIPSPTGVFVPLSSVAMISHGRGPIQIEREDQTRMVSVTSSLVGRDVRTAINEIKTKLNDYEIPEGYILKFGGENQQINEAFYNLGLALILGVILVYMVMASQFESLVYPLIIMLLVPLAFTGALISMAFIYRPLSVPAYLGLIMLAGIVVNNGIVLVDYINNRKANGLNTNEAILEGGPTRLRPILMTTITTILGLVPLALGIGEGSEIQIPLAVTVIGGLILSTILTLIVIPVLYSIADDLGRRIKRKG